MRILLDSNVWRYVVDNDAVSELRNAVRRSRHSLVAAPAVLLEAARTADEKLRNQLLSAIVDRAWKRLMPEVFSEAEEFKLEVRRVRPEWLRTPARLERFKRFRFDWRRSNGGLWDRIFTDVAVLKEIEEASGDLETARQLSREFREDALSWSPKWRTVPLAKILASLPSPIPGWNGAPIEPWRVDACNVMDRVIRNPTSHATIDWIEGEINISHLLRDPASHVKFWLHDVDLMRMPRYWLRWAFEFLQRQQRITDGTPVDAQIGTYLLEVDLMLSADKMMVAIAEKCRAEAPFTIAESRKVPGGSACVDCVLDVISGR